MGEMGNSEPAKFLPFHFVKFASLTSLVKDNFKNSVLCPFMGNLVLTDH